MAQQSETTGRSSDSLRLRPFSKGELLVKEKISMSSKMAYRSYNTLNKLYQPSFTTVSRIYIA